MPSYTKENQLYGVGQGIILQEDRFVIAARAPRSKDYAKPGYFWFDTAGKDAYISFKGTAGGTDWVSVYGSAGAFDSLTVTNNATIGGTIISSALTAGVVLSSATGEFSSLAHGTDGQLVTGVTGGSPVFASLIAGGGINIVEGAGTVTISNPGATGTTLTADDANVASPDGGGNTNIVGYDANVVTSAAVANTVKIKLADNIVSVASITATNDFTMTAGTFTATSDDNSAQAIYFHANAGVNETIEFRSNQGTGNDSLYFHSDVGGVYFAGGLNSVQAVNIIATDVAGGMTFGAGTAGIVTTIIDGVYTVATGTGNISIGADATDHDVEIGDAAGVNAMTLISGTGSTALTSTGDILIDADGVVEVNSTAGELNFGNDAVAQNMNYGTGAAERVLTFGNTTGASRFIADCGTAGVSIGASATAHTSIFGSTNTTCDTTIQSGSGAWLATAGGIWDVNAVGAITMDSTAGTISVGDGADAFAMNWGTGAAARLLTFGNVTGATSVVFDVGTGDLDLGVSATSHLVRAGSTSGTSSLTLQSGTGAATGTFGGILDINGTGDVTIDVSAGIFDVSVSGNITFDSSTGTIGIGVDDIDQAINIGTAGERVVTIGNQVGVAGVVVESGSAGMALNGLGLTSVELLEDSQAAAAVTVNGNNGSGVFTGITTASAASQQYTITNSVCTVNSRILCTVMNKGANDCKLTKERVTPLAGSFTVDCKNNGTQAQNGDTIITFWILKA